VQKTQNLQSVNISDESITITVIIVVVEIVKKGIHGTSLEDTRMKKDIAHGDIDEEGHTAPLLQDHAVLHLEGQEDLHPLVEDVAHIHLIEEIVQGRHIVHMDAKGRSGRCRVGTLLIAPPVGGLSHLFVKVAALHLVKMIELQNWQQCNRLLQIWIRIGKDGLQLLQLRIGRMLKGMVYPGLGTRSLGDELILLMV
jgi:hypothetical protein